MAVKVAINGFGRIGRLAFRQMFEADGYEVVAINDLTSPAMLAHLLKYDTAQGGFCGHMGEGKHTVTATEDSIIVDGKEIKIYAEKDAANCPWGKLDVDVVLECTGFYTAKDKAMAHITAGAKKVVISAPAGKDLKTIYREVYAAMQPRYHEWAIFDHCMPFDVTRAYDEARGIVDPQIWTAERDIEMWKTLES